jgi:hypothetical protein
MGGAVTPGGYKRSLVIGQQRLPYHCDDANLDTGTGAPAQTEFSLDLQDKLITRSHRVTLLFL